MLRSLKLGMGLFKGDKKVAPVAWASKGFSVAPKPGAGDSTFDELRV